MAQATARPTAHQSDGLSEQDKLKISLIRNARYHEDRERFFAGVHRWIMAFVIVGGVLTVASFMQQWPLMIAIAGVGVTLAGTLDLAFNVDGSARLHAALKHRVYALLAQAEDDEIPVEKLREQAALVYADEPPCMHAVNAVAYNGAMLAAGRPEKYLFKIDGWHRFWRNVFAFASTEFKTYEEIELEKRANAKSA
jgi:hypothetical protein